MSIIRVRSVEQDGNDVSVNGDYIRTFADFDEATAVREAIEVSDYFDSTDWDELSHHVIDLTKPITEEEIKPEDS